MFLFWIQFVTAAQQPTQSLAELLFHPMFGPPLITVALPSLSKLQSSDILFIVSCFTSNVGCTSSSVCSLALCCSNLIQSSLISSSLCYLSVSIMILHCNQSPSAAEFLKQWQIPVQHRCTPNVYAAISHSL